MREVLSLERLTAMGPAEAASWWTLRHAQHLADHERRLFDDWLAAAPEHAEAWIWASRAWRALDDAADDELVSAMRAHARAAAARPAFSRRRIAACVAALVLIPSGTGLLLRGYGPRNADGPATASIEYANGLESPRVVRLAGGTIVTLDSQTAIRVEFSAMERRVRFERGQAFFQVRHDEARPFVVEAAGRVLTDVGTSFNVALSDDRLEVVLAEGKLSVADARAPADATTMQPGQKLVVVHDTAQIEPADVDATRAWQSGLVEFHNEPITQAVATLNRHSREQLIISDPIVARLKVSGTFRLGDVRRFGRTFVELYPVRMVDRGNGSIELAPSGGGGQ